MRSGRKTVGGAVGVFLVAGIAGCTHGGPPVSARVSGKVEMVGGRYPGTAFPPQQADVLVTDTRQATVRHEPVSAGAFTFALSEGDYQVSARAGDLTCGRPRHVAVRSREGITLSFICTIM